VVTGFFIIEPIESDTDTRSLRGIELCNSLEWADWSTEKLYLDGPGADDWPALAQYQGSFVPALGPDHIFIPNG
jgi:hypothetical protein